MPFTLKMILKGRFLTTVLKTDLTQKWSKLSVIKVLFYKGLLRNIFAFMKFFGWWIKILWICIIDAIFSFDSQIQFQKKSFFFTSNTNSWHKRNETIKTNEQFHNSFLKSGLEDMACIFYLFHVRNFNKLEQCFKMRHWPWVSATGQQ